MKLRVNGINGKLFGRGGKVGTATAGQWLAIGMIFYLLKPDNFDLLGTVTMHYQQTACQ